jgi:hypothetical protein
LWLAADWRWPDAPRHGFLGGIRHYELDSVANGMQPVRRRIIDANLEAIFRLQDDVDEPGAIHIQIGEQVRALSDGVFPARVNIGLDESYELCNDLFS